MSLSEDEIHQRLVTLRNLTVLYDRAKERITLLLRENHELKQRLKELEDQHKDQGTRIEALSFQFEQIKN